MAAIQGSKQEDSADREKGVSDVTAMVPNLKMLSFGEGFTSLKQLCNRHCVVSTYSPSGLNSNQYATLAIPLNGLPPRINPDNRFFNDFAAYFSYAFLAERGGRRWKLAVRASTGTPSSMNSRVDAWISSRPAYIGAYEQPMIFSQSAVTDPEAYFAEARYGNAVHLDSVFLHPFTEFETPYLGVCQFTNPRKPLNKGRGTFGSVDECINIGVGVVTSSTYYTELLSAAADDYSLHGFFFVPQFRQITNT